MRFAVLLACLFSAPAIAQDQKGPGVAWALLCQNGKPVSIRLIVTAPGEIIIPLPSDLCAKQPQTKEKEQKEPPQGRRS